VTTPRWPTRRTQVNTYPANAAVADSDLDALHAPATSPGHRRRSLNLPRINALSLRSRQSGQCTMLH